MVCEGDTVAVEAIESGTFTEPFEAPGYTIAPTNQGYRQPSALFIRVNPEGLITKGQYYIDSAAVWKQVGLTPEQQELSTKATPEEWAAWPPKKL